MLNRQGWHQKVCPKLVADRSRHAHPSGRVSPCCSTSHCPRAVARTVQRACVLHLVNLRSHGRPLVQRFKTGCGKGCCGLTGPCWKWLGCEKLPSGCSFALLCMVLCKTVGDNDIDSPEDPVSGFRYQIALDFIKEPILGQRHWHKLPSVFIDFCVGTQTRPGQRTSTTQGSEVGWLRTCQESGQLCFSVLPLPVLSPHQDLGCINTC